MKILYIAKFDYCDYLNDMVFHGLKSLYAANCEESNNAEFMYSDWILNKKRLYGKGFTVYCKLDERNQTIAQDIEKRIKSLYYDLIVYGSVWRDLSYFDLVTKFYSKDEIVLLDGEDHQGIRADLLEYGTYFKRELVNLDTSIHPISFSIPKEVIRPFNYYKDQEFSTVNPNQPNTYVFDYEQDYYNDMCKSKFAITKKKAGWDCLRHYEIMAASCFPAFENIDEIPERTMQFFPKKLIKSYYDKHGYYDSPDYLKYLKLIHRWVSRYCTTEMSAKYVIAKTKGE